MSVLTQTLKKIINWQKVNYPESVEGLPPGLSDLEIEKLTKPFSFIVPRTVREIYSFCNGKLELAPSFFFDPLELAIQNSSDADWMRGDKISSSTNILPLFHGDGKDFYYVIWEKQQNDSPVWCVSVGVEPLEYAASLTNLILTSWECYETGAYYMDVDEDGYSDLEEDIEGVRKVFQKYNPEQMDTFRSLWGD